MPADLILEPILVPSGATPFPTVANGAGAGTAPPASILLGSSNSWRGIISGGSGTSPAVGVYQTFTFPVGMITATSNQLPFVQIVPVNTASAALEAGAEAITTAGFNIYCAVAPTASQAVGVYQFSYIIFFQ